MSCDPEAITGYVDEALDPAQQTLVEEHLAQCAECQEQAAFERDLRQRLRVLPSLEIPVALQDRVQQRLYGRRRRWTRWALPLAAVLVIGLGTAVWARATAPVVAWQLVRDHERCFKRPRLPARVWSSDPQRVTDWFEKQGTMMPLVPESAGGLNLVGARYCPLSDRRVAHLYYIGEDRHLSLFVIPGVVRLSRMPLRPMRGETVRILHVGESMVGLVSANRDTVDAFESSLTSTMARNARPLAVAAR